MTTLTGYCSRFYENYVLLCVFLIFCFYLKNLSVQKWMAGDHFVEQSQLNGAVIRGEGEKARFRDDAFDPAYYSDGHDWEPKIKPNLKNCVRAVCLVEQYLMH